MLKDILNKDLKEVSFNEKALEALETELASVGCGASGNGGSCGGWCESNKK